MLKIAFHSNQLCLTGTEIAMYDYARFNEELLGNRSIILADRRSPYNVQAAVEKFAARFPVYLYDDPRMIEGVLAHERADILYCIKAGWRDGIVSQCCKTAVHAVFEYREPHGDVYAYVSKWLADRMSGGALPFVPHMVNLPDATGDLRDEIGIPREAIVFGRHGGFDTFDIPFVQAEAADVAARRPDIYFLFMNTRPFCDPRRNIIFLEGTADQERKVKFINSCDAMLHARSCGETFGLAVGEFSIRNKPVITFAGVPQRSHIEILGRKGIYFNDAEELRRILLQFVPQPEKEWDAYSREFSPAAVMRVFERVFIGR